MELIKFALDSLLERIGKSPSCSLDDTLEGIEPETMQAAQHFLDLVLKYRIQCLSQVQYHTGYSTGTVRRARDVLVERKLIEPLRGCAGQELGEDYLAYRLAS